MSDYWSVSSHAAPQPAPMDTGPWDEPRIRDLQRRIVEEAPDVSTGGATEEERMRGWVPTLAWVQQETGLSPAALAGIMHAESRVGDSDLTRNDNNFFSVEANDNDQFMQGRNGRWASYPTPKAALARFVGMIAHPENTYNTRAHTWSVRSDPDALVDNLLAAGYGVDEPGYPMSQWRQNVRAGEDLYNQVAQQPQTPSPSRGAMRPYEQGGGNAMDDLFPGKGGHMTVIIVAPHGSMGDGGGVDIPIGTPFDWRHAIAPDGRGDDHIPLDDPSDCSAFISNLIAHLTGNRVRLPDLTDAQVKATEPVPHGDERRGDLLFSKYPGQGDINWGHVAMLLDRHGPTPDTWTALEQSTAPGETTGRPGIDVRRADHAIRHGGEMIVRRVPGLS